MTTWTSNELNRIGKAEELQIASLRNDGTLRNLVTIWVVRVDDDLYVRSVNGRAAAEGESISCFNAEIAYSASTMSSGRAPSSQ